MQNQDDILRKYFRSASRIKSIDPEDSELAYQLHHMHLNDPEIVDKLVNRYSEKLTRWLGILLYLQENEYPFEEQIYSTLNQVFAIAVKNVDQFYGNESVQDWLFSIAYKVASKNSGMIWRRFPFYRMRQGEDKHPLAFNKYKQEMEFFERLPKRQQAIVVLRYLFELSLQDISVILDQPVSKVHAQLKDTRKQMVIQSTGTHKEGEIEAFADGLLDSDPDRIHPFTTHLNECSECQKYATQLLEVENRLVEVVNGKWTFPPVMENHQKAIIQQAKREVRQPKPWKKIELPFRQTAWLLGLFIIFIGLAIIFISMTPVAREFPSNLPVQTMQSPRYVDMQPEGFPSKQSWGEASAQGLRDDHFSSEGRCGKIDSDERGTWIKTWTAKDNREYFLRKPIPHLISGWMS